MDFDFEAFSKKRPEINIELLKADLQKYYIPFAEKLINLRKQKNNKTIIVGISAIQGAGKTTQGEIMELLLASMGFSSTHISIDDFYITHQELNSLRQKDPRYIRRGVTHDINLAVKTLTDLKNMNDNSKVLIPVYDKGLFEGDGDRSGFREISKICDFTFFDGWMLGARRYNDESIFESGLPALNTPEHIQFAKDINKKLDEYTPLWDLIDFMNILYVEDYTISLKWRDQAEEALRKKGQGMSQDEIKKFVYYFWRSVHPAIQIKALAFDKTRTQQVVVINADHTIGEITSYV